METDGFENGAHDLGARQAFSSKKVESYQTKWNVYDLDAPKGENIVKASVFRYELREAVQIVVQDERSNIAVILRPNLYPIAFNNRWEVKIERNTFDPLFILSLASILDR